MTVQRRTRLCLIWVAAAALTIVGAPWIGGELSGEDGRFIFWQLRVPRVLMAIFVGGTLSLTGAVYQGLFRNALATPSTVGTLAGATLGALASIVVGVESAHASLPYVVISAFIGAATVSILIAAVAARPKTSIHVVLLAGIAITLAAGAISGGLQYAADSAALFAATQWSLGHLPQVGYQGLWIVAPVVTVCAALLIGQTRSLQALLAGEDRARSQGVEVSRARTLVLLTSSLAVSACVAWCGPIAFVGLIVPHVVRLSGASSLRLLLPLSWVAGATFLVASDVAARLVLPGRELPVGVITSAIGAPALLSLIVRRQRRG